MYFWHKKEGRDPLRDLAPLCDFSKIWFGFQIATFADLDHSRPTSSTRVSLTLPSSHQLHEFSCCPPRVSLPILTTTVVTLSYWKISLPLLNKTESVPVKLLAPAYYPLWKLRLFCGNVRQLSDGDRAS
jgi:hypothetical protein